MVQNRDERCAEAAASSASGIQLVSGETDSRTRPSLIPVRWAVELNNYDMDLYVAAEWDYNDRLIRNAYHAPYVAKYAGKCEYDLKLKLIKWFDQYTQRRLLLL